MYRYRIAAIKKEEVQIPFPTDRALSGADNVKTGLYHDKKHINV